MIMTLCATVFSILLYLFFPAGIEATVHYTSFIFIAGGTAILICSMLSFVNILMPVQYLEQNLIPNLMELFRQDLRLHLSQLILLLFSVVSFFSAALALHIQDPTYQLWLFFVWIILFGIALDGFREFWRRATILLNPTHVISWIENDAQSSIRKDDRKSLLNDIDTLSEIGLRSVEKGKLAASTQALQPFPSILKLFFDASKNFAHMRHDVDPTLNVPGGDEASYIVFYLLQRLELINDRALRERMETVCRQMIMTMGKITLNCAKFDLSMVSFPTHFLTKFGLKAEQHHFDEVAVLATSTLSEIAKSILTEIDVTYAELVEPFQSIINGLAALARSSYKKHREMGVRVLKQPFIELKDLFRSEKIAQHRDTPEIVRSIDNVLEEFSVLEQMLQSIPTIPGISTSEEEPT